MPHVKKQVKFVRCGDCGKSFFQKISTQVYCSDECRKSAQEKERRSKGYVPKNNMATGTTGAASELIVCADLLKKGFHVFRAQSPACPCDLIAMKRHGILRIEVRTGTRGNSGKLFFPFSGNDSGRSDVIAVVTHDWEISYLNHDLKDVSIEAMMLESSAERC
jgi:hypothetical protein